VLCWRLAVQARRGLVPAQLRHLAPCASAAALGLARKIIFGRHMAQRSIHTKLATRSLDKNPHARGGLHPLTKTPSVAEESTALRKETTRGPEGARRRREERGHRIRVPTGTPHMHSQTYRRVPTPSRSTSPFPEGWRLAWRRRLAQGTPPRPAARRPVQPEGRAKLSPNDRIIRGVPPLGVRFLTICSP